MTAGPRTAAGPAREAADPLAAFVRAIAEELVRAGVREAVLCPGSRSTPLALALAAHPGLRLTVLLDERSAGFFALGMARTAGRPVAILTTSGTAAVNVAPAVVEASLARAPLVVLTADRPIELRDRGAPQTIDQVHLYGRHVRWASELPLPDGEPATLAHARSVVGRAVVVAATGPAGPVHLNAPFREPLVPTDALGPWPELTGSGAVSPGGSAASMTDPRAGAPFTTAVAGPRRLDPAAVAALADRIAAVDRGLIVVGPGDEPGFAAAAVRLAEAAGYPIVADPLSGLRTGQHDRSLVVARGDQLVRPGPWIAGHRPELVVRFGAMPTSKPLVELLRAAAPELVVIDGDGGWREAAILPASFVHADPVVAADDLSAAVGPLLRSTSGDPRDRWLRDWLAAEAVADGVLGEWLDDLDEPFEGAPFPALADMLPDGAVLWVGSSMPVRDLDGWLPSTARAIRVRSNRGANGIDGVVSTALGSAAVAEGPVALVVGDISLLHDVGALVTARLTGLSLTVVLIANDGGGIFSFLPQATTDAPGVGLPDRFERLFGTPHGIEAGPIVEAFGGWHGTVDGRSLRPAIEAAIGRSGVSVLELRTDRARNVELHRAAAAAVSAALAELAGATGGPG